MVKLRLYKLGITAVMTLLMTGCVGTAALKKQSINNQAVYAGGGYQSAAMSLEADLGLRDKKTGKLKQVKAKRANVLMHLDAGEAWRLSGEYSRSNEHYDAVEVLFSKEDNSSIGEDLAEGVGSILLNDSAASYVPTPPERVLVNYYKALSIWSLGDKASSRIEFNRANERARLASESYEKEIQKAKKEAKQKRQKPATENEELQSAIYEKYPNIQDWEVYDSFVNPAVAYTNALFLMGGDSTDRATANTLLKRVLAMTSGNSVVTSDIEFLESNPGKIEKNTWIIYEAGQGPSLKENRFDIPFVIPDKKRGTRVILLSYALPEFVAGGQKFVGNSIFIDREPIDFSDLADMNKVAKTEFKKRWPGVLTRATVSAITKALLQNEAGKQNGMANLIATIYTAASTKADVRGWKKSPAKWYLAKLNPKKGKSILNIPYAASSVRVELDSEASELIYIKQPSASAKPLVTKVRL